MSVGRLAKARSDLIHHGLIAYQRPLYQVLALDVTQPVAARELDAEASRLRIGQLRAALGRAP